MTSGNILVIIGSAGAGSSNEQLVRHLSSAWVNDEAEIFTELKSLPHFDPLRSVENPPPEIVALRSKIEQAKAILICSPEYIFSIPSGLKNMFEWCVSTTVFSDKPTGIITASASGQKGHEELQLILKTLMARFTPDTTLLIPGIKGKINVQGEISDPQTLQDLQHFNRHFLQLLEQQ